MFQISLKHRSEREALKGDLAGQCQSHIYPSEDAKRPLRVANATPNNKNSNQTSEPNRVRTLIHTVQLCYQIWGKILLRRLLRH